MKTEDFDVDEALFDDILKIDYDIEPTKDMMQYMMSEFQDLIEDPDSEFNNDVWTAIFHVFVAKVGVLLNEYKILDDRLKKERQ